jgi:MFS family permease
MLGKVSRAGGRLKDSFSAFGAVFGNRDLRRVAIAWISTMIGQWAYYVALSVFAYKEGGAAAVGIVGLIRTIPGAISAPLSAMLADRYRRERVILVGQLGRLIVLLSSAAALAADAPAGFIYAAAGAMTVFGTAMQPANRALVPSLARTPQELTQANVALGSFESIALFVGPAIGGFLLAVSDEAFVFTVAAATSALAGALMLGIRTERVGGRLGRGAKHLLQEISAGFRTVAEEGRVRLIVGLTAVQMFVAGAFNVLIVAAALDLLDLGESGVGYLNSAVGIGGLLGAMAAVVLVGRERLASDFGIGILLWGIPLVLIGFWPHSALAFALLIAVGAGNTLLDVAGPTLLQRMVRDEVLGRVFGAFQGLLIVAFGAGMIAAPAVIELAGIRGSLIATGALLPVLAALFWRSLGRVETSLAAPSEEVALLRAVPIFEPLSPPVLEYLAGKLTTVEHQAGDVVFQQGDRGDRYYLIGDGQVEVSVDGGVSTTLGPGEGFGEIALLRDVPRTATVRAKTDATLYALERDEFIAAVSGNPLSTEAADTLITSRLSSAGPEVARL